MMMRWGHGVGDNVCFIAVLKVGTYRSSTQSSTSLTSVDMFVNFNDVTVLYIHSTRTNVSQYDI